MTYFKSLQKPEAFTFNFARAQVLLIDNDALSLNVVSPILAGFGFRRFIRCMDIAELDAIVKTQAIDLILIDPFGFGRPVYDWVHRLRHAQLANSAAPVLMVTAHTSVDDVKAAKACGVDYVVAKPFSPGVLLDRIIWVARHEGPLITCELRTTATQGSDRKHVESSST